MKKQLGSNMKIDQNLLGWESIVKNWKNVTWPRRPSSFEIEKFLPLVEKFPKSNIAILGATPEYRAAILQAFQNGSKPDLYLIEKSKLSYKEMTKILKNQFHLNPVNETILNFDWEELSIPKNTFNLILGDTVLGYFQSKERLEAFLNNCHYMLADKGLIILREFMLTKLKYSPKEIRHLPISIDLKRWSYIFSNGFAIENNTFYEEKLAYNLLVKVNDTKVYKTCANPPRVRLVLDLKTLDQLATKSGFSLKVLYWPENGDLPSPKLFVLEKR